MPHKVDLFNWVSAALALNACVHEISNWRLWRLQIGGWSGLSRIFIAAVVGGKVLHENVFLATDTKLEALAFIEVLLHVSLFNLVWAALALNTIFTLELFLTF